MKEKWIETFRHVIIDMEYDESNLSDEQVLEIGMGLLAPQLSEMMNVKTEFAYKLFFNAMVRVS